MDTIPGLRELAARKRELLLESDLNRQVLRIEVGRLGVQAGRLRHGFGLAHGVWKWVGPLAGFLFARKLRKTSGGFARGSLLLMPLLGGLWKIWQTLRSPGGNPDAKR